MQRTDDNATAREVEAATKSVKMFPRPSSTPTPKQQRRGRVEYGMGGAGCGISLLILARCFERFDEV